MLYAEKILSFTDITDHRSKKNDKYIKKNLVFYRHNRLQMQKILQICKKYFVSYIVFWRHYRSQLHTTNVSKNLLFNRSSCL